MAFVVLRLSVPLGWVALVFVFSIVGPVAVVLPSLQAGLAARRGPRLPWRVAGLYLTAAVTLVVAGALVPESTDQHDYLPLLGAAPEPPGLSGWSPLPQLGGYAAWTYAAVAAVLVVVDLVALGRREKAAAARRVA